MSVPMNKKSLLKYGNFNLQDKKACEENVRGHTQSGFLWLKDRVMCLLQSNFKFRANVGSVLLFKTKTKTTNKRILALKKITS